MTAAPKIPHRRDLKGLSEEFESVDGEFKFLRTMWAYLDDNDVGWRGEKDVRKYYITLPVLMGMPSKAKNSAVQFEAGLEHVPDEWLFPKMSPGITIAPNHGVGDGLYIKRPVITRYDPSMVDDILPTVPRVLLAEIYIMELLAKHPHPNIVRYHGCRVRRGRVTGLVLDRHSADLDAMEHDEDLRASVDRDTIMAGIEAAISHLHSLGLAHNDLNPSNVVIGKDKEAILIDFGSCQPFGEDLMSRGTPGWVDEEFTTSAKEHDFAALPKIRAWMDNVYQGLATGLPTMPLDGMTRETLEERGLI